jgi:hypothetical protein
MYSGAPSCCTSSINFINTYQVRKPAEVQANVGQAAAVVGYKAFTVLPNRNFFDKFWHKHLQTLYVFLCLK